MKHTLKSVLVDLSTLELPRETTAQRNLIFRLGEVVAGRIGGQAKYHRDDAVFTVSIEDMVDCLALNVLVTARLDLIIDANDFEASLAEASVMASQFKAWALESWRTFERRNSLR